jgi:sugar phosphate isomerase/epimerase
MPAPPPLALRSWKGVFAFPLGSTSFIYPAGYAENVARLAPCLDAVELLFFESEAAALPGEAEIGRLADLAQRWQIRYNVHLPLDLPLGSPDPRRRRQALESAARVLALTCPLNPTTWTVHLNPHREGLACRQRDDWCDRLRESLARLLDGGLAPRKLSVENLLYPFAWVEALIAELGLSICLDIGHLLRLGGDPLAFFERHAAAVTMVHLHGLSGQQDHRGLESLDPLRAAVVRKLLRRLRCEVSLELFDARLLLGSLALLERWMLD